MSNNWWYYKIDISCEAPSDDILVAIELQTLKRFESALHTRRLMCRGKSYLGKNEGIKSYSPSIYVDCMKKELKKLNEFIDSYIDTRKDL